MNILIDGCIFSDKHEGDVVTFWTAAVPGLASALEEHYIYFLNREFTHRFPDRFNLKNLCSPCVDWERSALEDRRLAFLCRELEVDVFVSTYFTSAGTNVRSLFVATEKDFSVLSSSGKQGNDPLVISDKRAAGMACRSWAIPTFDSNELTNIIGQLARVISEVAGCELSDEDNARRIAEEHAVIAQASILQQIALNGTIEINTAHRHPQATSFEPVPSKRLYRIMQRLYYAITNPHKWPQYIARLLHWVRHHMILSDLKRWFNKIL